MSEICIRLGTEADLPAINEIYNYYVETSTCTFQLEPESDDARRNWFAAHRERHPVTVLDMDGEVAGWGSLSPFRERAGYANTVEPSVYVRHDRLGRGFGRLLLVDLIQRAKTLEYHTMLAGACSEQEASVALQEALGFEQVAYLKEVGFKFGRWLDVLYMQLMLSP